VKRNSRKEQEWSVITHAACVASSTMHNAHMFGQQYNVHCTMHTCSALANGCLEGGHKSGLLFSPKCMC
jgi:hypothetical protein